MGSKNFCISLTNCYEEFVDSIYKTSFHLQIRGFRFIFQWDFDVLDCYFEPRGGTFGNHNDQTVLVPEGLVAINTRNLLSYLNDL